MLPAEFSIHAPFAFDSFRALLLQLHLSVILIFHGPHSPRAFYSLLNSPMLEGLVHPVLLGLPPDPTHVASLGVPLRNDVHIGARRQKSAARVTPPQVANLRFLIPGCLPHFLQNLHLGKQVR